MSNPSLALFVILSIPLFLQANPDQNLNAFFEARRNFANCLEHAQDKQQIERCCATVLAATIRARLNYHSYECGHSKSAIDSTLKVIATILHAPESINS